MSLPAVLDPRDPRPSVQRALRDWLSLQEACALRPERALARLESGEGVRQVLHVLAPQAARGSRRQPVAGLAAAGAVAVPLGSPAYPPRLARLPDRPLLLLVRGDVGALSRRAVAVVGARSATAYGRHVARELAAALVRQGLVVISGLARGIDGEAHRGALEAGGPTVAVQGCGPDQVYPAAHRALAARIVDRGALLCELPPGTPPLAHHFPLRNRLIAGLAECLVVVEARARSGTLSTVRHALDQGADVLAVPGPITAPTSAGPNRLIADGATPCLHVDDVLALLGLPLSSPPPARRTAPSRSSAPILAALEDAPATPDELVRRLDWPAQQVATALLELELEGWVARESDGRLRALALRPGR